MNNTKHITFNPDGSQKEPNWDKIDQATKEMEERDAVDTENMLNHIDNCNGCAFCEPDL